MLVKEYLVVFGNTTVWPEVGENAELVALLLGKSLLNVLAVDADCQKFDVCRCKRGEVVAQFAQLAGANAREREWVEHHNNVFLASEVTEGNGFAELVG